MRGKCMGIDIARLKRIESLAKNAVEYALDETRQFDVEISRWMTVRLPYWVIAQLESVLKYKGRFDNCDPPCMLDAPGNRYNPHGKPDPEWDEMKGKG
jgi:hypothetical protein